MLVAQSTDKPTQVIEDEDDDVEFKPGRTYYASGDVLGKTFFAT